MINQLTTEGYTVAELTAIFQVSRSTLYWRNHKTIQAPNEPQDPVETAIVEHARQNRCTCGVKRLRNIMAQSAEPVKTSERKIRRVLTKYQLKARAKRAYTPRTTQSDPSMRPSPNLLKIQGLPTSINQQWVSDITYIATLKGWCYLCSFMDRYSRRILGWSIDEHMTKELVIDAFEKALRNRGLVNRSQLIVHSDRGGQYTSRSFREQIRKAQCAQSMSPKGDCYANAHAESLWATIKNEAFTKRPDDVKEAKMQLFDYIETFYNPTRAHSSLSFQSPIQFEKNILSIAS